MLLNLLKWLLDEAPNSIPGDILFVISQKNTLSLIEKDLILLLKRYLISSSLTGYEFILKTLDGRSIKIKTPHNYIIKPPAC